MVSCLTITASNFRIGLRILTYVFNPSQGMEQNAGFILHYILELFKVRVNRYFLGPRAWRHHIIACDTSTGELIFKRGLKRDENNIYLIT